MVDSLIGYIKKIYDNEYEVAVIVKNGDKYIAITMCNKEDKFDEEEILPIVIFDERQIEYTHKYTCDLEFLELILDSEVIYKNPSLHFEKEDCAA